MTSEEIEQWARKHDAERAIPVPIDETTKALAEVVAYADETRAVGVSVDPRHLRSVLAEVRRLTTALDGVRREERERCAKVADESAALWQRPMGASGRVIPERMETGHAVALVAVQIRALPDDATGSAT